MTAPTLAQTDPGLAAIQDMKHVSTFALNEGFGIKPTFYKKDNGTHVYKRVAVFRSGTFSDSMGYENTWEKLHLDQMVNNWNHLRDSETFANVPVRDGHPGWIINGQAGNGKVVGWHTSLSVEQVEAPHDGIKYHYLFADYEILDEDAKLNIASGLWRNRSSEIGTYKTNSQAEHWPVYMGVAYVDIPAVEGLNFSSSQAGGAAPKVYVMFDSSKEKNVGETPPAAPSQDTQSSAGTQQHGAPAAPAQPFVFSVNGANTSDFGAVQAHITALEQFRSDTTKANRENFVTALAAANKIQANQLNDYKELVLGMSPDQYTKWSKLHGDMEIPALLGQHGVDGGVANGGQAPAQHSAQQAAASEVMILKEQIAMHSAAGTSKKTIQTMSAYKKLVALDPSFQL